MQERLNWGGILLRVCGMRRGHLGHHPGISSPNFVQHAIVRLENVVVWKSCCPWVVFVSKYMKPGKKAGEEKISNVLYGLQSDECICLIMVTKITFRGEIR